MFRFFVFLILIIGGLSTGTGIHRIDTSTKKYIFPTCSFEVLHDLFVSQSNPFSSLEIPSFDLLQQCSEEVLHTLPMQDLINYNVFKSNFEKNYKKHGAKESLKIPKEIHFIWLGPKPFPDSSIENVESWIRLHPGWKVNFWTDDFNKKCPSVVMKKRLVQEIDLDELQVLYQLSTNFAEKSDILRYAILSKLGGIYVDHDVICYQSFDEMHYEYDFYCCLEAVKQYIAGGPYVYPGNSLIAAKPNHPILIAAIQNTKQRWNTVRNEYTVETDKVLATTFTSLHLGVLMHLSKDLNIDMVFPATFFCGESIWKDPRIFRLFIDARLVFCNHLYAGTWWR